MVIILGTSFLVSTKITSTIGNKIRNIEWNNSIYLNSSNWIVNIDWIKNNYSFTWIKCTSGVDICFNNNLNLFYDSNWDLKTKQIIYFTNNNLSIDFTKPDWYKNGKNIKDINTKLLRGVYIPPLDQLWTLAGIKNLNILLWSQSNLKEKFFLSSLWFK